MLQRTKDLLLDNSIYIAILGTILITYLSLAHINIYVPKPLENIFLDKIEHFIAYSFLSFFWLTSFRKKNNYKLAIIILVSLYGAIMELSQFLLTNHRIADIYDILANVLGVLLGFLIYIKSIKIYKII
ncbi:MAG: VanZ family protein [Flavobacteriaceae bacterium]|nr:VanZ family protein [Flavobacteriaceae bacterium]